jgi:type I restriction enzyme S subunit
MHAPLAVALRDIVQADRPITYGIVQPGDFVTDGIQMIQGLDYSFGWRPEEDLVRVTPEVERPYRRSRVKGGDVLMTIVGAGTGNTAIVPDALTGANISRTTARIAIDPEKADPNYVLAVLRSKIGKSLISKHTKGGTRPGLNLCDIEEFQIPLPTLDVQRIIATLSSVWDEGISRADRLAEAYGKRRRALLSRLLAKHGHGEWTIKKLSDVCLISKGEQKNRTSLSQSGSVPVINGGVSPSGYTNIGNTHAGTITISEGGNSCGYVALIEQDFWCGGHCYALKELSVERNFLFAYLKSREPQIMALRVGSGLPNIQKSSLSAIEVPIPCGDEQKLIGEFDRVAERQMAMLAKLAALLRRQKRGLIHKMLAGDYQLHGPNVLEAAE